MRVVEFFEENISSLIIGIFASLLAILLQIIVQVSVETISYYLTSRLIIRRLFCFSSCTKIFVVSGAINHKSELSLLSSSDADAAANIVSALRDVFPKIQLLRYYTTKNAVTILNENIVTIGGPVHNACTKHMLDSLNIGVSFDSNDALIFDGCTYSKSLTNKIDYGLVIRTVNPYSTSKKLLVIAGCGSHGVLAASLLFDQHREFKKLFSNFKSKRLLKNRLFNNDFIVIIKCKMTDNYISNLEIQTVKKI